MYLLQTYLKVVFACLQGMVRFSALEAAKKGAKAVAIHAAASARQQGHRGQGRRADAPEAAQQAARQLRRPRKGMARRLQQSATELAHAWEQRRASPTWQPHSFRPDGGAQVPEQIGPSAGGASGSTTVPGRRGMHGPPQLQPIAEEAAAATQEPHVWVQLAVKESNLEGLAMFTSVRVQLHVAEAGSRGRHAAARAAGKAACCSGGRQQTGLHLPNLGGLLRPPAWVSARGQHAASTTCSACASPGRRRGGGHEQSCWRRPSHRGCCEAAEPQCRQACKHSSGNRACLCEHKSQGSAGGRS